MSKCLFYRKKINFTIRNFTKENVRNFVTKRGRAEMKFNVKMEQFYDELEFKFHPNVKWDRPNSVTEKGLGVSIGSNIQNDFRSYKARIRLHIMKENGELHYCSTATEKYIFDRINEKSKMQRPMMRLDLLFDDQRKFLTDDMLKIYIEMEVKSPTVLSYNLQSIALNNYETLVNNQNLSDFQFICSDGKQVFAHKCILTSFSNKPSEDEQNSSNFFRTMLESNMRESKDNCMQVSDIDSKTMLELMRFVYCEKIRCMDTNELIPLMFAADKYDIVVLRSSCIEIMHNNLSVDNVVKILTVADTLDSLRSLKENCIDFIKFNYDNVKLSGMLQNMKFEALEEIIDSMNRESILLNFDEDLKSILALCDLFYGQPGNQIMTVDLTTENVRNREVVQERVRARNWDMEFD